MKNSENFNTLVEIIDNLESDRFTHQEIATIITNNNLPFKQEGNWKESWMILHKLVKMGFTIKEEKTYLKNG